MTPALRLLWTVGVAAGFAAAYVAANRVLFGFDPLDAEAWQGAADAFTGVPEFRPLDAASWRRAIDLSSRPGPHRFATGWVIDDAREVAWLIVNGLAVVGAPLFVVLRARPALDDAVMVLTSIARSLATWQRAARGAQRATVPAAGLSGPPGPSTVLPQSSRPPFPDTVLASPAADAPLGPAAALTAVSPARSPAAHPVGPPVADAFAQPSASNSFADADIVRDEIDAAMVDYGQLRLLPEVTGLEALIQQLERAVDRSNAVEMFPPIVLRHIDVPTPPNRVIAAGDATRVVLLADRPSAELHKWGAALADWLGDQIAHLADDETFSDAFNPLTPVPVVAAREPGENGATEEGSADVLGRKRQVRPTIHVAVARLDEHCAEFSNRYGPVHPALRDLLDDVFGYT